MYMAYIIKNEKTGILSGHSCPSLLCGSVVRIEVKVFSIIHERFELRGRRRGGLECQGDYYGSGFQWEPSSGHRCDRTDIRKRDEEGSAVQRIQNLYHEVIR